MFKVGSIVILALSLVGCAMDGKDGEMGEMGANGTNGTNGTDGTDGIDGERGPVGPAGPQLALPAVYTLSNPGGANAVSADRLDGIWLPLLPEIWKSPVWGNGLSSILWSDAMRADAMLTVGHPHNAYLEAILDMGFLGLALLGAYYLTVWRGFRALGSNAYISPEMRGFFQGAFAALLCFGITGWAGSSLRPSSEFAYLWVAIGMMYGMLARKPAA